MFGYVRATVEDLTEEEKSRYKAVYCGLCRTLGQRHGITARLGLTYDMTFLILFLSSLYEPEEESGTCRCIMRPCKSDDYTVNEVTDYAADMTVALVYHKCMDDWKDDRKLTRRSYAALLKKAYGKVRQAWPEQVAAVEACMKEIADIEKDPQSGPDAAANSFGTMLSWLFLFKDDHWKDTLRTFGYELGRFIYAMDAVMDCEADREKDAYNPVLRLDRTPEEMRELLTLLIGRAAQAFERLPMVQDAHLLRNILYSGVWLSYNQLLHERKEAPENG